MSRWSENVGRVDSAVSIQPERAHPGRSSSPTPGGQENATAFISPSAFHSVVTSACAWKTTPKKLSMLLRPGWPRSAPAWLRLSEGAKEKIQLRASQFTVTSLSVAKTENHPCAVDAGTVGCRRLHMRCWNRPGSFTSHTPMRIRITITTMMRRTAWLFRHQA